MSKRESSVPRTTPPQFIVNCRGSGRTRRNDALDVFFVDIRMGWLIRPPTGGFLRRQVAVRASCRMAFVQKLTAASAASLARRLSV